MTTLFDTDIHDLAVADAAAHTARIACHACGGAHPTQACPEVKAAMHDDGQDVQADPLGCLACQASRDDLRLQLARAHEALGQAIAAMDGAWELADAYKVIGADAWEPDTIQARRRSEELLTAFDMAIVAARAALG